MISIETRFPLSLRPVLADDNQLEMAVLNLVVNARDAMPNGGNIIIAAREETITGRPGRFGWVPARTFACPSLILASGWMRLRCDARSSPFTLPKAASARVQASDAPWSMACRTIRGEALAQERTKHGEVAEMWLPVADTASAWPVPSQGQPGGTFGAAAGSSFFAVDDDEPCSTNTSRCWMILDTRSFPHPQPRPTPSKFCAEAMPRGCRHYRSGDAARHWSATCASVSSAEWPALPVILATGFRRVG